MHLFPYLLRSLEAPSTAMVFMSSLLASCSRLTARAAPPFGCRPCAGEPEAVLEVGDGELVPGGGEELAAQLVHGGGGEDQATGQLHQPAARDQVADDPVQDLRLGGQRLLQL